MEQIRKIEKEIYVLKKEIWELKSRSKEKGDENNFSLLREIKDVEERIEYRKNFIAAITKNIETNKST